MRRRDPGRPARTPRFDYDGELVDLTKPHREFDEGKWRRIDVNPGLRSVVAVRCDPCSQSVGGSALARINGPISTICELVEPCRRSQACCRIDLADDHIRQGDS